MSKPMVVTLPVILILLDYWPLERLQSQKVTTNLTNVIPVSTNQSIQETKPEEGTLNESMSPPHKWKLPKTRIAEIIPLWQIWEKIPFFVLSAVFSIITIYAQFNPSVKHYQFPLGPRLANAPVSFMTYLEKAFVPNYMAVFYPFSFQLPAWQVWGSVFLILFISVVVIISMRRLPYLFTGWLWYAITLLPVIGIIPVGGFSMADRFTYLPLIGITVMLAWGIPPLIKSEDMRKKILFPASMAFLAILTFLTWQQCGYWKNSINLFNHTLQVTKDNYLAHNNLALALLAQGRTQEAIDHYNKAIRLRPDDINIYSNRGNAYAKLGQRQRAIEDYNEAIQMKPDYATAYINRGNVYNELGQYQMAIEDFNKAVRLRPDYADTACNSRGSVYYKLGQYQMAIEDFNNAIRLKPDYADAYNNRGIVYFTQGNNKPGCFDAQKACALGSCKTLKIAKAAGLCR
jgi:tetratricopeptide (TPR) repeat protein